MKKIRLLAILLFVAILGWVFSVNKPDVSAQAFDVGSKPISITWVNFATIKLDHSLGDSQDIGGKNYVGFNDQEGNYVLYSQHDGGGTYVYTLNGAKPGDCTSEIVVANVKDNVIPQHGIPREVNLAGHDPFKNTNCSKKSFSGSEASIKSPENSRILFNWLDKTTLLPVGLMPSVNGSGNDAYSLIKANELKFDETTDYFLEQNPAGCPARVKVSSDRKTGDFDVWDRDVGACNENGSYRGYPVKVGLGFVGNSTKEPGQGELPEGSGSSSSSVDPEISCETQLKNPLSWIACPILNAADEIILSLDNAITQELDIDVNQYFNEDKSPTAAGYFQSWSIVRYISMTLLVIIALVMIISQALGMEVFDAYSVRKILPRLVVSVIFISVSWPLLKFAVEASNILGVGVRQIIYAPFSDELAAGIDISGGGIAALSFGPVAMGLAFGLIGLLSFALTGFLAVALAFVVLVFRKLLIIILMIFAPLAIIASILPGTRRAWNLWNENFFKALLAYPIISAFIAFGKVFASVTSRDANSGIYEGGSSLLGQLIVFVAYFGPYFALPLALRLAGGLIATLGGVTNDRSRGVFDRLRKGRQVRTADRIEKFRSAGFYGSRNKQGQLTRRARVGNLMGGMLFDTKDQSTLRANRRLTSLGINSPQWLAKRAEYVSSKIDSARQEASIKWLQHVNQHGANDKFYRAVGGMYEGFTQETKQRLVDNGMAEWVKDADGNTTGIRSTVGTLRTRAQFDKMASILDNSTSRTERNATTALRASGSYTEMMFRNKELVSADTAYGSALGLASHGFYDGQDIESMAHAMEMGGASSEYILAAATNAELEVAKRGHAEAGPGYGHYIDKSGRIRDGLSSTSDAGFAMAKKINSQEIASLKGGVIARRGPDGEMHPARQGAVFSDILNVGQGGERKQAVINKWAETFRKAGYSDREAAAEINTRIRMSEEAYQGTLGTLGYIVRFNQGSADVQNEIRAVLNSAGLISPEGNVNIPDEIINQQSRRGGPGAPGVTGGGVDLGGGALGGDSPLGKGPL